MSDTTKPALPEPSEPSKLLSRILHELAGAASLCWGPKPTGVFDSQRAIGFVEQAIAELRTAIEAAVAEVNALNGALTDKCNNYIVANARLAEQVAEARAEIEALKSDIADALTTIAVYEAEARAVPEGCACRWDAGDKRVQTCERHQGWLDVIAEWADRARAAEAMLAATPSPAEQTRSQKLAEAGFTRRPSLWAMQAREALELIAAPRRPDGSWNRDREACRQIAAEALGRYDDEPAANPAPVERAWIGSIPAEESDAEFAAQIARMDAKPAPVERVALTDEQIDAAIGKPLDDVLDHIYEYGTAAEGIKERARRIARAVIAEYERANGIGTSAAVCRASQVGPDKWVCDCGGPPCIPSGIGKGERA